MVVDSPQILHDEEHEVFLELNRLRTKSIEYLVSIGANQKEREKQEASIHHHAELTERVREIVDLEKMLGECWKRLAMDMHPKGNLSNPLKRRRTPLENWIVDRVAPVMFLQEFLDIEA